MFLQTSKHSEGPVGPQIRVQVVREDSTSPRERKAKRQGRIPARAHFEVVQPLGIDFQVLQVLHEDQPVLDDLHVHIRFEIGQPPDRLLQRVVYGNASWDVAEALLDYSFELPMHSAWSVPSMRADLKQLSCQNDRSAARWVRRTPEVKLRSTGTN